MAKKASVKKAAKRARKTKASTKARARAIKKGPSKEQVAEALRRFVRAKGASYLKDPNITSIGVGRKNGTGPICLQFSVGTKGDSAIEALGSQPIPETIEVEGMEILTDVVERSFKPSYKLVGAEALGDRKVRMDPMLPGISIAHTQETAGTIGLIVFDRSTGAPCVLSNWHVLHGNHGAIGDGVVQPGPFDDNNVSGNESGTLLRSHLGAAGDCALARIRGREFEREVFELGVVPMRMADVSLDDRVIKSGRTTGVTYGIVRRVDVIAKINYGIPTGNQEIGGFEIGVDPANMPDNGEISMGGDSGSAWLIADGKKATDIFAGLHFAGETGDNPDEHALACYPLSVQKKLDFLLDLPAIRILAGDEPEAAVPRAGYDPGFLGVDVPLPKMSLSLKRDTVNFGRSQTIPYTHFSVCLSAERRMARFVAWNIDGARKVVLPRRGFKLDSRIDVRHQIGNEVYVDNVLDRGHIARRADLAWGPIPEADQANRDSFFYTNIAPQHERFNQSDRKGLWGRLENAILEQADVQDIKVSAIAGPFFRQDDIPYRGALVPRAYWKLVAYVDTDGDLRVAAFVLSQADLLHDLEGLDLDPFRLFQVSVSELSERATLDFSALERADVISRRDRPAPEAEALRRAPRRVVEIVSEEDLLL